MELYSSKIKKFIIFRETKPSSPKIKKFIISPPPPPQKKKFYISRNGTFLKKISVLKKSTATKKKSEKISYILENGTF